MLVSSTEELGGVRASQTFAGTVELTHPQRRQQRWPDNSHTHFSRHAHHPVLYRQRVPSP